MTVSEYENLQLNLNELIKNQVRIDDLAKQIDALQNHLEEINNKNNNINNNNNNLIQNFLRIQKTITLNTTALNDAVDQLIANKDVVNKTIIDNIDNKLKSFEEIINNKIANEIKNTTKKESKKIQYINIIIFVTILSEILLTIFFPKIN